MYQTQTEGRAGRGGLTHYIPSNSCIVRTSPVSGQWKVKANIGRIILNYLLLFCFKAFGAMQLNIFTLQLLRVLCQCGLDSPVYHYEA